MIRTQVYITEDQYQRINQIALGEKRPTAEIFRDLIDVGLSKKKMVTTKNALLSLVDLGKKHKLSGPKNISTKVDDILYIFGFDAVFRKNGFVIS